MAARPDTGTGRDTRAHVAAGHHTATATTTTRGDLMSSNTPSAGVTLAAAEALQDPTRETFTREQVAYLMRLAYDSGRTATYLDDIARIHCTGLDNAFLRRTYEQRVADELADIEARFGPPRHHGGPVDWETGRPVRHLEVAA